MMEWGIFNDDSETYCSEDAVEAGFYSQEDAQYALETRYTEDDGCYVHSCQDEDDDENEDN